MNNYVLAEVLTDSLDDKFFRVKLKSENVWVESPLICSVNAIPLKKGDLVIVDVSQGYDAPIIIGKHCASPSNFGNAQIVAESQSKKDWSVIAMSSKTVTIKSSTGMTVEIGDTIKINGGKLGPLVVIDKLTSRLNELVDVFNNHVHPVTIPSGLVTAEVTPSRAQKFSSDAFADKKVKH